MQARLIDNEIKMMRQESLRLGHEREQMVEKIADNTTKIKQNKVLPYLVSKVVEVSRLVSGMVHACSFPRFWTSMRRRRRGQRTTSKTRKSQSVL
jgi:ATP-dependent 26S proteasome regulatory subunit